jgi:murein DD-endopeptidase MepM/ murein hydrolase activator NlpD
MKKPLPKSVFAGLLSLTALLFAHGAVSSALDTPLINWAPPLEPPINLVNLYRQPNSDYSAGHRGIDYQVTLGQSVLAPADGEVWFSGKVVNRYLLSLKHPDGNLTEFEPVCTDLQKGEPVFLGQEIGEVCEAESSYRQHCQNTTCLHFSIRKLGAYLSPQVFIGGINPSRLLAQGD